MQASVSANVCFLGVHGKKRSAPTGAHGPRGKSRIIARSGNLAEYSYLGCIEAEKQNRPCLMTGMVTGFGTG